MPVVFTHCFLHKYCSLICFHTSLQNTLQIQKSFFHRWQISKWKLDNNQLHSAPAFGMIAFELKPTVMPTVDIRPGSSTMQVEQSQALSSMYSNQEKMSIASRLHGPLRLVGPRNCPIMLPSETFLKWLESPFEKGYICVFL